MLKIIAWPAFRNKEGNPYNHLLYTNIRNKGVSIEEFSYLKILLKNYDIWHLHWPEKVFSPKSKIIAVFYFLALLFALFIVRRKKTKIVWTIHNLESHEKNIPAFQTIMRNKLVNNVDGIISLTRSAYFLALKRYPILKKASFCITPHGHYLNAYKNNLSSEEAKRILNIPFKNEVLCYIGSIRPYKNVNSLIRSFKNMQGEDLNLVVAGKPISQNFAKKIKNEASGDKRIKLFLNFIPNKKIQIFLNAASLIVLPYIEILNSGSAILAISFNRPVVVPAKGSMMELRDLIGSEWVFTYRGELNQKILYKAIKWHRNTKKSKVEFLDKLNWEKIADKTIKFYKKVLRQNAAV